MKSINTLIEEIYPSKGAEDAEHNVKAAKDAVIGTSGSEVEEPKEECGKDHE